MSGHLRRVTVSCPGKIILIGEYSLSWGRTGTAAAINRRTFADAQEIQEKTLHLYLPDIKFSCQWAVDVVLGEQTSETENLDDLNQNVLDRLRPLVQENSAAAASLTFLYLFCGIYSRRRPCGLKVSVTSKIPIGAGLGSSAAYCVCLTAALCRLTEQIQGARTIHCSRPGDIHICQEVQEILCLASHIARGECCCNSPREQLQLINKWALIGEKIIHGITSGIDNAICTFGGVIAYKQSIISSLTDVPTVKVLVVDSKVPHSTRVLGLAVKEKLSEFPQLLQSIFDSAEQACFELQRILCCHTDEKRKRSRMSDSDIEQMGKLLDIAHHLVLCMGPVDHPRIEMACDLLRANRMHCKLTGAGGGGSIIALMPASMTADNLKYVKDSLECKEFEVWETTLGCCGVVFYS